VKKIIVVVMIGLLTTVTVHAAGKSFKDQCVVVKTKVGPGGKLVFLKPVSIETAPNQPLTATPLNSFASFVVVGETDTQIKLATVPDYSEPDPNKGAGKVIGWGWKSDFRMIELRNCN